jgi:hypothetical protein
MVGKIERTRILPERKICLNIENYDGSPPQGLSEARRGEFGLLLLVIIVSGYHKNEKPVIEAAAGHPSGWRPFIITWGMEASAPIIEN